MKDLRLHIWGLMRGMDVGGSELVETAMLADYGCVDPMNRLGTLVGKIQQAALPNRVYRTHAAGPHHRAIVRTA